MKHVAIAIMLSVCLYGCGDEGNSGAPTNGCEGDEDCAADEHCRLDNQGGNIVAVCQEKGDVGDDCGSDASCKDGLACAEVPWTDHATQNECSPKCTGDDDCERGTCQERHRILDDYDGKVCR